MILSDYDLDNMIRSGRLVIKPFSKDLIRENGVDLRLADQIGKHNPKQGKDFVLDPYNAEHVQSEYLIESDKKEIIIGSHEQMLMSTEEYVKLPNNIMGFVELRSTWARHGLMLPPTIIDAGFEGNITLEVFNATPHAIKLTPGVRFSHIIFAATMNTVEHAYSGKYSGQKGVRIPKVLEPDKK